MEGEALFFSDPRENERWGPALRNLPQRKHPCILVACTGSGIVGFQSPEGEAFLAKLCAKHGIKKFETQFVKEIGSFWIAFFNNMHFLSRARTVPSILVATGEMRTRLNGHMGYTIGVSERLREIASFWDIPFELTCPPANQASA
jgi:hypothetical protein